MRLASLPIFLGLLGLLGLAACAPDTAAVPNQLPGLDPPDCTRMSWEPYRIVDAHVGRTVAEANANALDIDHRAGDGPDNLLGAISVSLAGIYPRWTLDTALSAHLATRGATAWVLLLGTCAGTSELRVRLARGIDPRGDGVYDVLAGDVAAVGRAGTRLTAEHGVAAVPIGMITDGGGAHATDAWQRGLGFTADLARDGGDLVGRIGFAVDLDTDEALAPLAGFFTDLLVDHASAYTATQDANHDGVIDVAEVRSIVSTLVRPDVDVGACDDIPCLESDGTVDHESIGLAIRAVPDGRTLTLP